MRTSMRRLFVLLALLLPAAVSAAELVNKSFFSGVAIDGYDPVAYFTDQKPVEGSAQFEHSWNGAKWRFASAAHRDLFAADPSRYAPKYGGFCAYAVAKDSTADIDPEAWSILDGKLYLNYDLEIRETWLKDAKGYITRADENWKKIGR